MVMVSWWCDCGFLVFKMPAEYGEIVSFIVSTAEAKGRTGQIQKSGACSYVSWMNSVLTVSYRPGIS